jgi:hypothetical protein
MSASAIARLQLTGSEPLNAPGTPSMCRRTLICVANTHIHANPELNDVKLWQVHTLLKGLEKIAARWGHVANSCAAPQ